jgi:hypothetical protein
MIIQITKLRTEFFGDLFKKHLIDLIQQEKILPPVAKTVLMLLFFATVKHFIFDFYKKKPPR